jgi:nucleoside 2-deoxyribosyltransferase
MYSVTQHGANTMAIIFFSHGTADYPIVESFKNELEQMKSEVYLFEHDCQPNQDITNKVQKNIDRADIVTVLLTKQSEHSAYVQQEIGYAERARKPILPLVETGKDPNSLAMLTGRQYISFDPSDP